MDKKNKKHNKKKNNNKSNNQKHNKSKTEEQNPHAKLSAQERVDLNNLVSLMIEVGVLEHCTNPNNEWRQYQNVQKVLNAIQQVELPLQRHGSLATFSDERLLNIEKFYQWAKENGLQNHGLEIKKFSDFDLGLVATNDIEKGDLLFKIPRELILSEENLPYEYINNCFTFSNMRLAFTLMIEYLKPDSFWKPYIDMLPATYKTVLYYTVDEMAELKGSNALSPALKLCQIIASLYVNIYSWPDSAMPLKDFKEMFSYDLLRWAVSTVMTRENLIPRAIPVPESPDIISALIPFWDMANHRTGAITSFFNIETQEMESEAQENFKKGEQVYIHYGDRSNAELMIHNGFINPQNPKDWVNIKLGINTTDTLFSKRNELLQLLKIPKSAELKVLPQPEYISPELLAFVRVFNMNEEQLDHWIESERAMDLFHNDCALETELETKTWQYLEVRLDLLLRFCPHTLEDDEQLFESLKSEAVPKRNYIQMMTLEYRILEKRILTAALDYAKQRTKA